MFSFVKFKKIMNKIKKIQLKESQFLSFLFIYLFLIISFAAFKRGKINRYTESVGPMELLKVCQEIVGNKGSFEIMISTLNCE